jgi:carbamate kinase
MAPKVEAAAEFADATGHEALITDEQSFGAALAGSAGTHVVR